MQRQSCYSQSLFHNLLTIVYIETCQSCYNQSLLHTLLTMVYKKHVNLAIIKVYYILC